MRKAGLLSSSNQKRGFTLLELLIVCAIIAILAAIAIPVFSAQLERARNATDVYNAKIIARSVQYYFIGNPDKLDEFIDECESNSNASRPYILVTDALLAIGSDPNGLLKNALSEAGLIRTEIRPDRFSEMTCKSRDNWKSYTIGFTVENGELLVGFCGTTNSNLYPHTWAFWTSTDPTPFRNMCTATGS